MRAHRAARFADVEAGEGSADWVREDVELRVRRESEFLGLSEAWGHRPFRAEEVAWVRIEFVLAGEEASVSLESKSLAERTPPGLPEQGLLEPESTAPREPGAPRGAHAQPEGRAEPVAQPGARAAAASDEAWESTGARIVLSTKEAAAAERGARAVPGPLPQASPEALP